MRNGIFSKQEFETGHLQIVAWLLSHTYKKTVHRFLINGSPFRALLQQLPALTGNGFPSLWLICSNTC